MLLAGGSALSCCPSGNNMTLFLVTSVTSSDEMHFQILTFSNKSVIYDSNDGGAPCSLHMCEAHAAMFQLLGSCIQTCSCMVKDRCRTQGA